MDCGMRAKIYDFKIQIRNRMCIRELLQLVRSFEEMFWMLVVWRPQFICTFALQERHVTASAVQNEAKARIGSRFHRQTL